MDLKVQFFLENLVVMKLLHMILFEIYLVGLI